ncbi:endogenous retrovirus group K member 13-1 Env polyprotein-like isoform X1 [Choloepus didactylus]|uniref:endogenous retrovirus group K member 13-1 Env polyprotein-like isoform X1 n=1 Tax=Choloepus didactylus TaxID=27675 RepID=UPI00189E9409|nr:endogenous retrovirus group K member 13-1 Env polyprotein-like isoform X1 [Choloepus didactylus]
MLYENNVYTISCMSCLLTNSISNIGHNATILVLKQPPFVMLPVKTDGPWYDSPGLQALQEVNYALKRQKRIIGAIIVGITALISIIGAVVAVTTALVQEVHTARYVDALSRNVMLALAAQENIDKKLEAKVNTLEEAVETLGNQLLGLRVRLLLRCHIEYQWICVTPKEYNESLHAWHKIQMHLQGVWNNSDISLDLSTLHKEIQDIPQSDSALLPSSAVASDFLSQITSHISNSSLVFTLYSYIGIAVLVLILLIFLPIVIKLLFRGIQQVRIELATLRLKNKKGGDAGSQFSTRHSPWAFSTCCGDCSARRSIEWHL